MVSNCIIWWRNFLFDCIGRIVWSESFSLCSPDFFFGIRSRFCPCLAPQKQYNINDVFFGFFWKLCFKWSKSHFCKKNRLFKKSNLTPYIGMLFNLQRPNLSTQTYSFRHLFDMGHIYWNKWGTGLKLYLMRMRCTQN